MPTIEPYCPDTRGIALDSCKLFVVKWTTLLVIPAMAAPAQLRVVVDKPKAPAEWALLEPGSADRLTVGMKRYALRPVARQPWDQGRSE